MDLQTVVNLGIGLGFTAVGWWAKTVWNAVQELKNDLAKLREELPKVYVPKDDFKDFAREIKQLLLGISEKLDHKVDK